MTLRSRSSGAAASWTPAWSRGGAMQRGCGSLASRRKRGIRVMALLSQMHIAGRCRARSLAHANQR